MANTFDRIQEDTTSAIVFSRFQLAMKYDNTPAFMPPPLNVLVIFFFALFYLCHAILICCTCCNWNLESPLMDCWRKKRETDDKKKREISPITGDYWICRYCRIISIERSE
eukprot:1038425_1